MNIFKRIKERFRKKKRYGYSNYSTPPVESPSVLDDDELAPLIASSISSFVDDDAPSKSEPIHHYDAPKHNNDNQPIILESPEPSHTNHTDHSSHSHSDSHSHNDYSSHSDHSSYSDNSSYSDSGGGGCDCGGGDGGGGGGGCD